MTAARHLRWTLAATMAAAILPLPAFAHGIGGRQDLPVPVEVFVAGAGTVLALSFAALAVLWPKPRLQDVPRGREIEGRWVDAIEAVLGVLGLLSLLLVVVAGLAGADSATDNPASVLVFVGFWLVVPFVSALVTNVYPALDPWRRLTRWVGIGATQREGTLDRLGLWPATVSFVAFTWLELVAPDAGPRNLAVATLVYTGYMTVAAAWGGRGSAKHSFDGFAAYNRLLGGMAPIGRDTDGILRWRGWLRGLPHIPEETGLVAFVVAMIGTVTYDGLSGTPWWAGNFERGWQLVLGEGLGLSRVWTTSIAGTVGLLAVTALVGGAYVAAAWSAARLSGGEWTAIQVTRRFAHTLVPIGFAYAFAHYFTLVVFEGQLLFSTLSDPFGRGWDLFGTAGRSVDYSAISPTAVWYIQVGVIVSGHLAGVTLAHDRALADFAPATAVRSQYAMLALMVFLTGLGLVILAAG